MAYWHYASQVVLWDEVDNSSWVELEIILVWWGCSISKLISSVISRLRQAECWYPAFIIFNQKMRMFSNGKEKIRFDIVVSEQVYLRRKEVYWHRSSLEARNAEVSLPISLQWVGERGGGRRRDTFSLLCKPDICCLEEKSCFKNGF